MHTYDIAVCGSGIGGLATALALHGRGHRITLYEKADPPRPIGSGLMLQPTGQAALARLGLLNAALQHGALLEGIAGHTHGGRTIFDLSYNVLGNDYFGIGIHRGSLFSILDEARQSLAIPVVTAADIATIRPVNDKRVLVDRAASELGAYDLVVDAMGLHSPLRQAFADVTLNRPYPYGAVWGVCRMPADWPNPRALTQRYDGARKMIGVLPIGCLKGSTQPLVAFFGA